MIKLLITGSNSFLGKQLINNIDIHQYELYCIDIQTIKNKKTNFKYKKINLNNKKLNIFDGKFDIIIHLAAVSNEFDCQSNINNCYNTNIGGTINLLNNIDLKRLKKFIFASSEWIYPSKKTFSNFKSKININKFFSHYANTKYLNEKLLNIYSLNYKFISLHLRFGILYGERLKNFSAFESLVFKVYGKKYKKIINIGSKKTGRNYLHVDDAAKAIIKSIKLKKSYTLDVQGANFTTLEDIIKFSSEKMNRKTIIKELNKNDVNIKKINSNYSNKILNWSPKISSKKGIEKLIYYFSKEHKKNK